MRLPFAQPVSKTRAKADTLDDRARASLARLRAQEAVGDQVGGERASCATLGGFLRRAWPIIEPSTPFLANWHQDAICEYLEAVTAGQITRLLVNMPPRYMKSITVSIMWPCWEWTKSPHRRWMFASYSGMLSNDHAMARRAILQSAWYQGLWGEHVRLTNDLVTDLRNDRKGYLFATSFGAAATGRGGNRVVIDDPHSPKKALSDVERAADLREFDHTFSNRLNDKRRDALVVVMQRLHHEDIAARCLELGYTHLCLPAVSEGRTTISLPSGRTITREDGELLWPGREGHAEIEAAKLSMGEYAFCTPYESPILMEDLSMKPIGEVRQGDIVVGFTTDTKPVREGERCSRRKLVRAGVLAVSRSVRPVVRLRLSSGAIVRCTADHKWYMGRHDISHPMYRRAKVGTTLHRVCDPKIPELVTPEDIRNAGWLAGFYDAEGSAVLQKTACDGTSCLITITQGADRNLKLCVKLEMILHHFGFDFGCLVRTRRRRSDGKSYPVHWYYLRGDRLPTYQKFLHVIGPTKWRERIIEGGYGPKFMVGKEKVVAIEPDGQEEVFGLTTTTGNYIVWGLASSNSGQYQQRPSPLLGGMFPATWPILPACPPLERTVRYWDKAGTQGGGAYTAGVKLGRTLETPPRYVIVDVVRGQWSASVRERVIKDTAGMDGPNVRVYVEREPGSGGKESAENTVINLAGFTVEVDLVTGDKVSRAGPIASQAQIGNVYLVKADWNKAFIDEARMFPMGKYKDQVDASGGAFNKVALVLVPGPSRAAGGRPALRGMPNPGMIPRRP